MGQLLEVKNTNKTEIFWYKMRREIIRFLAVFHALKCEIVDNWAVFGAIAKIKFSARTNEFNVPTSYNFVIVVLCYLENLISVFWLKH